MPISSDLNTLLTSNKISNDLYSRLPESEKMIFNKLTSNNPLELQNKINDIINRFNILRGEILINNDNPDLLKELRLVILELINYKIFKISDVNYILQQIFLLL